jgi:hypothetical protein
MVEKKHSPERNRFEGMDCLHVAQDRAQWRALVNTTMSHQVALLAGIVLAVFTTICYIHVPWSFLSCGSRVKFLKMRVLKIQDECCLYSIKQFCLVLFWTPLKRGK